MKNGFITDFEIEMIMILKIALMICRWNLKRGMRLGVDINVGIKFQYDWP